MACVLREQWAPLEAFVPTLCPFIISPKIHRVSTSSLTYLTAPPLLLLTLYLLFHCHSFPLQGHLYLTSTDESYYPLKQSIPCPLASCFPLVLLLLVVFINHLTSILIFTFYFHFAISSSALHLFVSIFLVLLSLSLSLPVCLSLSIFLFFPQTSL